MASRTGSLLIAALCWALGCKSIELPVLEGRAVEDGVWFDDLLEWGAFRDGFSTRQKGRSQYELWQATRTGRGAPEDEELGLWFLVGAEGQQYPGAAAHRAGGELSVDADYDFDTAAAVRKLRQLAASGDPEAGVYVAELEYGNGDIDEDERWQRIEQLAQQGSGEARSTLADVWRTRQCGVKWLARLAADGDVERQLTLGDAHMRGDVLTGGEVEALRWYRKALAAGSAVAAMRVARIYLNSERGVRDEPAAIAALELAATEGRGGAEFELGRILVERGDGQDDEAAGLRLVRRAAFGGFNREASQWLGRRYVRGQGETVEGKVRLGECFDTAMRVPYVQSNLDTALRWYHAASEAGSAEAAYKVGRLYLFHCDRMNLDPQDAARHAVEQFRRGAVGGHLPAQCALGLAHTTWWHAERIGIRRDPAVCVRWLRAAADRGYAVAQLALGRCYESGYGVDRSKKRALRWYGKACGERNLLTRPEPDYLFGVDGRREAMVRYGWLATDGSSSKDVERAGVACLRVAHAEYWSEEAAYLLGSAYALGRGVPRDTLVGAAWFRRADNLGYTEASSALAKLMRSPMVVTVCGQQVELGRVNLANAAR